MTGTGSDAPITLEQLNDELYAAIEAGDLDRMGRVWLDHPHHQDVICVHPGWPPIQGRDQVLRSWAAIMANTSYLQFFLTDVQITVRFIGRKGRRAGIAISAPAPTSTVRDSLP